jgi:hypothetical protein
MFTQSPGTPSRGFAFRWHPGSRVLPAYLSLIAHHSSLPLIPRCLDAFLPAGLNARAALVGGGVLQASDSAGFATFDAG